MVRAKFTKVCETVIRKSAGKSHSEIAEAIADALELVLEMESPDLDTGAAQEKPIDLTGIVTSCNLPTATEAPSLHLPGSPSVQKVPEARLIVTPGEAKTSPPPRVAPIKINRRVEDEPGEDQGVEHWTVPTLVAELHENTPETLEVKPYGTESVVVLQRNILADHVLKAAKLVYTLASLKPTQPWIITPGDTAVGRAGAEPPTMSIDLPVFRDFFVTDKDLMLPDKIDAIAEDARKVYAPRQKEIHSSTPRRTGPIRFDPNCPHTEADILTDQQGRQF
jgi:hypothetical protein